MSYFSIIGGGELRRLSQDKGGGKRKTMFGGHVFTGSVYTQSPLFILINQKPNCFEPFRKGMRIGVYHETLQSFDATTKKAGSCPELPYAYLHCCSIPVY